MGKTTHVENLAAFRKESADIRSGVHGAGQDLRMLVWGLRLAD
jgi:hypothetical protein